MLNEPVIPPIDTMPNVFRIVSTSCVPMPNGRGVSYRIELYHHKAQLAVTFTRAHPDIRLRANLLVSVRWKLPITSTQGAIQISRLVILEHPIKGVNPFETVPPRWVKDRNLVKQAKRLIDVLPDNLQQLVSAIFWDGMRFRMFCEHPASVHDRHSNRNRNLRHTVDECKMVRLLWSQYPQANLDITLTAALLHNAGKPPEYDTGNNGDWCMTDRGKLVWHRYTVLELVAVALATNRIVLTEKHRISLLDAVTSAPNAEWLGILSPMTPEATLLSMAIRKIGENNALTSQLAQRDVRQSYKHPHHMSKNSLYQPMN